MYFLLLHSIRAQTNLVPNPGFEELEFCPSGDGQLSITPPWEAGAGTPDIFHECATNALYRTPYPYFCMYLPPHSGKGYTGITVYGTREFLETSLTQPLEAGRPYYVRFFVGTDEDCHNQPPGFSDAISLQLRRNIPDANFEVVAENSGHVIDDTLNWKKISRCYYAKGKEQKVRIGNPKPDAGTIYETTTPDDPFPENYMFLDDIFVGTFDPFPDTMLLCPGEPLPLDASFLESEYEWSTGETEAIKIVTDTGRLIVQATLEGCVFRDTFLVMHPPQGNQVLGDSLMCGDENIVLTAPLPGTYQWSNQTTGEQITVATPGLYSVTVTNNCGDFIFSQPVKQESCRCRVFVPNIFSPNEDNRSDLLDISFGCEFEYALDIFEIYDRWGTRVFATQDMNGLVWDGSTGKGKAPPGVYVWRFTYTLFRNGKQLKITEQGDVTVIR